MCGRGGSGRWRQLCDGSEFSRWMQGELTVLFVGSEAGKSGVGSWCVCVINSD